MRAARRDGKYAAQRQAVTTTQAPPTYAVASKASIIGSRNANTHARPAARIIPTTKPRIASRTVWRSTIDVTPCAEHPSAMRIPNSFVRCVTRYDNTPYTPENVNNNAIQAIAADTQYATRNG